MTTSYLNRIWVTTTTTGTGTLTQSGVVTGSRAPTAADDGKTFTISIVAVDANGTPTGQEEICQSVYTHAGTTWSRGALEPRSSRIDFGAGTKRIAVEITAEAINAVVHTPITATPGSTVTLDITTGNYAEWTAAQDETVVASGTQIAGQDLTLIIVNDATFNRTITFGSGFREAAALVGAKSRAACVRFKSDGTYFYEISRAQGLIDPAAFQPSDLSGLVMSLDSFTATKRFQESTGASATTPAVAPYDSVGSWIDESGNSHHATAPSTKPRLEFINGQPAIAFGGSQYLQAVDDPALDFGTGAFTVVVRCRSRLTNRAIVAKDNSGGSGNGLFIYHSGTSYKYYNGTTDVVFGAVDSNTHVLAAVRTSTSANGLSVYYDNGSATLGTDSRTLSNANNLTLGAFSNGANLMTGEIYDLFIYSRALNATELTQLYVHCTRGLGDSATANPTGQELIPVVQSGGSVQMSVTKLLSSPLLTATTLNPILADGTSLYNGQFVNKTDGDQWTVFQSGLTANKRNYLAFNDFKGLTHLWLLGVNAGGGEPNASPAAILYDNNPSGAHRMFISPGTGSFSASGGYTVQAGDSLYNASGSGGIQFNADPFGAGATGGVTMWSGGTSPHAELKVNGGSAGETSVQVYDITGAALRRVSIGAADSGGAGFRVLRIPN